MSSCLLKYGSVLISLGLPLISLAKLFLIPRAPAFSLGGCSSLQPVSSSGWQHNAFSHHTLSSLCAVAICTLIPPHYYLQSRRLCWNALVCITGIPNTICPKLNSSLCPQTCVSFCLNVPCVSDSIVIDSLAHIKAHRATHSPLFAVPIVIPWIILSCPSGLK